LGGVIWVWAVYLKAVACASGRDEVGSGGLGLSVFGGSRIGQARRVCVVDIGPPHAPRHKHRDAEKNKPPKLSSKFPFSLHHSQTRPETPRLLIGLSSPAAPPPCTIIPASLSLRSLVWAQFQWSGLRDPAEHVPGFGISRSLAIGLGRVYRSTSFPVGRAHGPPDHEICDHRAAPPLLNTKGLPSS
jgi:hypothetical protein